MRAFESLGESIDRRWREVNRDEARFPEIAAAALLQHPPGDALTRQDVTRWLMETSTLPMQFDPAGRFGQPPITVFQGPGFFIDVLVWTRGATDIHTHSFSGAFQMFDGECLHSRFAFEPFDRVSGRMSFGNIRPVACELLERGATRPIVPGDPFIHSTYHLGRPSCSVVVRTPNTPRTIPQMSFRRPLLAIDPIERLGVGGEGYGLLHRQLHLLRALQTVDAPEFPDACRRMLERGGPYEAYCALSQVAEVGGTTALDPFLDDARRRLGERLDRLLAVVHEAERVRVITQRLRLVRDPDHHLLVALLMVDPGRAWIADVVRRRRAGSDPWKVVSEWVKDLTKAEPGEDAFLRGVDLDDDWGSIFEALLDGRSVDETIDGMKEEFDVEDLEEQRDLIATFDRAVRASPVLSPLFRGVVEGAG